MLNLKSPRWTELTTAFGTGEGIPALLSRLAYGDESALWEVMDLVVHQGTRFEAAPAVAEFLADLCFSTPSLYSKIAACLPIISLGHPESSFPDFFDEVARNAIPAHSRHAAVSEDVAAECFEIGKRFAQRSTLLLKSEEDLVRAAATYACFWFLGMDSQFQIAVKSALPPSGPLEMQLGSLISLALGGRCDSLKRDIPEGTPIAAVAGALDLMGGWSTDCVSRAIPTILECHPIPWFDGYLDLPILWVSHKNGGLPQCAEILLGLVSPDPYRTQSILRGLNRILHSTDESEHVRGELARLASRFDFGPFKYAELDELLRGAESRGAAGPAPPPASE